jgi:predicted dehydrogenase
MQVLTQSVLIVGLGGIGFKYDNKLSDKSLILTHSHAFDIHPNFKIVGAVDLEENNISDFEKKYNCKTYTNIEDALIELSPNVVVIATPTKTHKEIIKKIFKISKPNVIVCEKPLAYTLQDAEEIIEICKINQSQIYVNYMRNSSKTMIDLKNMINDKIIKPPFKIIQWYSKGIINSASHFITLFNYLFGIPYNIELLSTISQVIKSEDFNIDFKINYKNAVVYFLSQNNEDLFHNSFELIAKNGRLLYERGGEFINWFPISNNGIYSGYNIFTKTPIVFDTDFSSMQLEFVNNLWKKINDMDASICTGDDALKTMKLLNKILNYKT